MDDDDIWGFDQADRDNLIDMCSDDEYFDNYHQQMYGLQSVQPPLQVGGQLRGQYFYFDRIGMKQCKKFNKASTWYKWKFHDLPNDFNEIQRILSDSVETILREFSKDYNENNTFVQLGIMHPTLETPIQSDYILLRDLTPLAIVSLIVKVAQSKRDLNLQDEMGLYTAFIELEAQ